MKTLNLTTRLAAAAIAVTTTLGVFTAVVSGPQREVLLAGARPAATVAAARPTTVVARPAATAVATTPVVSRVALADGQR